MAERFIDALGKPLKIGCYVDFSLFLNEKSRHFVAPLYYVTGRYKEVRGRIMVVVYERFSEGKLIEKCFSANRVKNWRHVKNLATHLKDLEKEITNLQKLRENLPKNINKK